MQCATQQLLHSTTIAGYQKKLTKLYTSLIADTHTLATTKCVMMVANVSV